MVISDLSRVKLFDQVASCELYNDKVKELHRKSEVVDGPILSMRALEESKSSMVFIRSLTEEHH